MKNAPFRSHLPLVLLIDISKSTEDIRELINKCQKQMLRAMMEDVALRGCVYLYILHFNGACEPVVEFELLDSLAARGALNDDSDELDIKKSYGCTNTGRAIMTALQREHSAPERAHKLRGSRGRGHGRCGRQRRRCGSVGVFWHDLSSDDDNS